MKQLFIDKAGFLRPGYQIALAFLFYLVPMMIIGPMLPAVIGDVVSIVLIFVLFTIFFRQVYKKAYPGDVDCFKPSRKTFKNLGIGLLIGLGLFSAIILILAMVGVYTISYSGFPISSLLIGLIAYIAVGLAEELMVRGGIQHALMKYDKWVAIVLASLIFSSLHLMNPGASLYSFLNVFMAAIFIGMLMYATRSITVSIGFHIAWNWAQGYIFGSYVSGTALVKTGTVFAIQAVGANTLLSGGDFGVEASIVSLIALTLGSVLLFFYGRSKKRFDLYDRMKKQRHVDVDPTVAE